MKTTNTLRTHGFVILGLLVAQYVLGILTNLFIMFPENKTDWQQWDFAKSQLLLVAHIILGILLLFGSIALLVRAIKLKDRTWKIVASIGLVSILLAIVSGSEFVSTQQAAYSLGMSILFIIVLGAFGWGIYKTKN